MIAAAATKLREANFVIYRTILRKFYWSAFSKSFGIARRIITGAWGQRQSRKGRRTIVQAEEPRRKEGVALREASEAARSAVKSGDLVLTRDALGLRFAALGGLLGLDLVGVLHRFQGLFDGGDALVGGRRFGDEIAERVGALLNDLGLRGGDQGQPQALHGIDVGR